MNKLYRIEYKKDGEFIYSTYLRMNLEDVAYNAAKDATRFGWTFGIAEAAE